MPAWCVQLHIYDLFEKAQLKLSPSIENCVQQDYIPELYVRHLPSYQKCPKLLHPPGVDCSPFPWTFMGNPGDGEKSYLTAKYLLISRIRKIPLNRFKSFAVKSFISSPSNSNFQVIILCNLHLSFLLYHILNFRLYVHTCHANLTNQCLLNVAFSIEWSKLSQEKFPFPPPFHSLHPSNAISKTLLLLLLVFLFFTLSFLFQTL